MAMPSASSTSADPLCELADRLPCLATAAPEAAATMAAAVEILKVPTPSPPVPTTSMIGVRRGVTGTTRARIASANPAISSAVSPLARKATRNPAICAGVASPSITADMTSRASPRVRSRPSSRRVSARWIVESAIALGPHSRLALRGRSTPPDARDAHHPPLRPARRPARGSFRPAGFEPRPVAVVLHGGFWRESYDRRLMDASATISPMPAGPSGTSSTGDCPRAAGRRRSRTSPRRSTCWPSWRRRRRSTSGGP